MLICQIHLNLTTPQPLYINNTMSDATSRHLAALNALKAVKARRADPSWDFKKNHEAYLANLENRKALSSDALSDLRARKLFNTTSEVYDLTSRDQLSQCQFRRRTGARTRMKQIGSRNQLGLTSQSQRWTRRRAWVLDLMPLERLLPRSGAVVSKAQGVVVRAVLEGGLEACFRTVIRGSWG